MDKRILLLKKCVDKDKVTLDELASELDVTPRQVSRLLRKWTDEGYILYKAASGKKKMKLEFLVDIETKLLNYFLEIKPKLTLTESKEYYDLPWSKSSMKLLKNDFLQFNEYWESFNMNDKLTDYIESIPQNLTPNLASDHVSYHIIRQISDTLYTLKGNRLIRNLVKFDVEHRDKNELYIYLRESILFSDGIELSANHVKKSLDDLRQIGPFKSFYNNIEKVTVHGKYDFTITVSSHLDVLKYQLTLLIASIFRVNDYNGIIGTGAYYIESMKDDSITLSTNLFYSSMSLIPEVKKVELKVEKNKEFQDETGTEVFIGRGFLAYNPNKDVFNQEEKHVISSFLKYVLLKAQESSRFEYRFYDMDIFVKNDLVRLLQKQHLKIFVIRNKQAVLDVLKMIEEVENVHFDYTLESFEDYEEESLFNVEFDIFIMNSTYQKMEPSVFNKWVQLNVFSRSLYQFCEDQEEENVGNDFCVPVYELSRYIKLKEGHIIAQDTKNSQLLYKNIVKDI